MIPIEHRAVAADVGTSWEYDDTRRVVELVVGGVGLVIPVCSHAVPRFGAYPVVRLDARGASWRVIPICFGGRRGVATTPCAQPYPLATDAPSGIDPDVLAMIYDLNCAPTDVARALENL